MHLAKVSLYFERSASVLHTGDFFCRMERFKAVNFRIEALVSIDRWAEVGSLSYIICTLETRRKHRLYITLYLKCKI